MWNWLVSSLASKATIVLFDGNPFHPGPADAVRPRRPARRHPPRRVGQVRRRRAPRPACARATPTASTSLRTICSTGSPLAAEGFDWVYDAVKPDVHLASISGGTDLCGCFVAGDPTRPVWAGRDPGPGARHGRRRVGRRRPPRRRRARASWSAPRRSRRCRLGFWGDADGSALPARAYFERFPGVWAHGDFAAWTDARRHGHPRPQRRHAQRRRRADRHGRDLPPGRAAARGRRGHRRRPGVGRRHPHRAVRAAGRGRQLDDELEDRIRRTLRERCSPRHVPARIAAVADIPRTRSGKITELAVADVVQRPATCATPRPSPTPRRSSSSAIAPSWRR